MIAWIANNAPWMRDSPVNTGFFVLRNGAASPRAQGFISRWWHFAHAANAHLQGPLYEQAALQRMWPMRGVEALSDGNKTGPEWRYMSETSDGITTSARTPVTHAMSLHGTVAREATFRKALAKHQAAASRRGKGLAATRCCRTAYHEGAQVAFVIVRAFNHSLAALSKLATPHPPVFDRQLQLDSEATPQQARRARSAQAKLMRGWSCERDVNAPVPCLPSSLASESPFLKKYCPKFDKAIHECAQLCEEHPQCVVFLHNLYGHCYLRTARGVVTAETSPSHGTMLCRRSGVTAPQEPQGESEEAMPTRQRRHDRLGMDWEYQPHLTNSK